MADDGNGFDPVPVGTTTAFGNTAAADSNDPLIDWASNLKQDDLAKFLHDPQAQAADWAARGHPPPSDEVMQRIHDHNDGAGTPSRSVRAENQPGAPPLDMAPVRTDARTGRIIGSATGDPNAARSAVGGQPRTSATKMFDPAEESGPQPGAGATKPPDPGALIPRFNRWRNPNDPSNLPAPAPAPTPAPAAPAVTPTAPVVPVSTAKPPGSDLEPVPEAEKAAESEPDKTKAPDLSTPEGRKKLQESLSTIGKAMQGVKAPEALRPPNIGAPAVRGPLSVNAPQIAQLMGLGSGVSQGQVPASAMPILKLLGRI